MSEENQVMSPEEIKEFVLAKMSTRREDIELDEENFIDLFENSLSLSASEKKKVLDSMFRLSQFQFDSLIDVFNEEREKFRALAGEHPDDIKILFAQCKKEWVKLGELLKLEKEQVEKSGNDEQKIDDLKQSLGL